MTSAQDRIPSTGAPASGERLLRLRDVEKKVGIARATIYVRMEKGTFPRPLQLSPGAVRWKETEIDAWIEALPRTA